MALSSLHVVSSPGSFLGESLKDLSMCSVTHYMWFYYLNIKLLFMESVLKVTQLVKMDNKPIKSRSVGR